jgi:hypothetical protein
MAYSLFFNNNVCSINSRKRGHEKPQHWYIFGFVGGGIVKTLEGHGCMGCHLSSKDQ